MMFRSADRHQVPYAEVNARDFDDHWSSLATAFSDSEDVTTAIGRHGGKWRADIFPVPAFQIHSLAPRFRGFCRNFFCETIRTHQKRLSVEMIFEKSWGVTPI
jgi:hypothetical protein